jgi:hypothetical protein
LRWSITKGSQSYWNSVGLTGVPFGSAFDCTTSNDGTTSASGASATTGAISIIDLSETKWQIDTKLTKWSLTGSNRGHVDITNPSRIIITANGGCGTTTTASTGTVENSDERNNNNAKGYIIISEFQFPQVSGQISLCQSVV